MTKISKKKVLLVDDEPGLLYAFARLLRDDYDVKRAIHGKQALDIVRGSRIDCIVLDLVMPEMDGIEFLKTIRDEGRLVPVVILTGRSCLRSAEECANLNVRGYLNKPCSIEDLKDKIEKVISRDWQDYPGCNIVASALPPGLKKALNYVDAHYHYSIGIKTVSKESGVSAGHLGRLFRTNLGVTFTAYVNRLRIDRAKELLEKGDFKLFDIMCQVGYKTEQHFFRQFKEYTGTTPRGFKEKHSQPGEMPAP